MDVPAGFEFSFKCPMKETAGFLCTRLGCYGVPSVLVNYLHNLIPVNVFFNCYLKVNYEQLKADHYIC